MMKNFRLFALLSVFLLGAVHPYLGDAAVSGVSNKTFQVRAKQGGGFSAYNSGSGTGTDNATSAAGTGTVTGGAGYTDGQSIVVTGSGFGTNAATFETLMGPSGVIESGTVDDDIVPRTDWTETFGAGTAYATRVQTTRFYSGAKSLNADSFYSGQEAGGTGNRGRFGVAYDFGSSTREVVVDYMAYFDNAGIAPGAGQWKMVRFTELADVNDVTGGENFYLSRGGWALIAVNTSGNPSHTPIDLNGEYAVNGEGWHRIRVYYRAPSSLGASDAILRIRIIKLSDNSVLGYLDQTGWRPLETTGAHFRYVIFQNYQGNGYADAGNHTQVWMDDNTIIKGSGKFAVIANASTWGARTHDELVTWSAWSNTSITINFNKGGFSSLAGPFYLYTFDGATSIITPTNSTGTLLP